MLELRKGMTSEQYEKTVINRVRAENAAVRARQEAALTAEEIAANFIEKYNTGAYREVGETADDYELGDVLAEQANLPDMRDPKLYKLKCKEGMEAFCIIALMNKFVSASETNNPMGIMSAVSTGRSTIFIEAYREAQVRNAVLGITDLYGWKPDALQLVPIQQMTTVLQIKTTRELYQRGMYARFARGQYRNDLVQVVDVMEGGAHVLVRVVPRINLALLAVPKENRTKGRPGFGSGSNGTRPPQRFFDWDEVRDALGANASYEVRTKWGLRMRLFHNMYFGEDGLLYKEIRPQHLVPLVSAPTVEEIAKFREANSGTKISNVTRLGTGVADEDEDNEQSGSNTKTSTVESAEDMLLDSLTNTKIKQDGSTAVPLAPGDSVIVVKGDLQGLSGKVVVINPGGTFTLAPSAESAALIGITDRLEISLDEAIKTFAVGDHVKVTGGVYRGETGAVLQVRSIVSNEELQNLAPNQDASTTYLAVLLLDSGQKTVEIFVRDLQLSNEVVTSIGTVEGYEQYDLVEVPGVTDGQPQAGVLIGIGQREVKVLLHTNTVKSFPVSSLRGRLASGNGGTTNAHAVDINGAQLSVGDVVKVLSGPQKDATGTIKHIYRMHLFLHNYIFPDNAGMFVPRSRHVVLATTNKLRSINGNDPSSSSNSVTAIGGVGKNTGRRNTSSNLGKSVRIKKGRFVGRIGIVRNETDTHYSVELHQAQQKHVTVAHGDVDLIDNTTMQMMPNHNLYANGGGTMMGGTTPFLGGATPMIGGSATPAYGIGGATPMYGGGGKTPMYGGIGGATPMYGTAIGGQTPMISGFGSATPVYGLGGQTPAYTGPSGGRTPLIPIGGRTPSYGGTALGGTTPSANVTPAVHTGLTPMDAMNKIANQFNLQCDIPWCVPMVKVELAGGNYRGKKATIKRVSETNPTVTVTIEGSNTTTNVNILDLHPLPPIMGSSVRILQGTLAGKVWKVASVTDEVQESGYLEAVVFDPVSTKDTEILPCNILVMLDV